MHKYTDTKSSQKDKNKGKNYQESASEGVILHVLYASFLPSLGKE